MDTSISPPASASNTAHTIPLSLEINGQQHSLQVEPFVTLLDLLRTVIVDGKRINSCLKLAVSLDGASVTTIEGIGTEAKLHPLQQAFIKHDAFQCGYCTPGQICSAKALLDEGHCKSRADVREWMSGNLCRCGAYNNITDAVMEVLEAEGAKT
jgi:xanthine dehydrogenase YagT iron-sulfur-binding subunit